MLTKTEKYLHQLCVEIPNRRVGSEGNRSATDFFARTVSSFGFKVECPTFDCIDWVQEGASLQVGEESFDALVSPYSLGCQVRAPLVIVSTVDELKDRDLKDRVLLMTGEIAKEQLMPKNFPFYNPDEHKEIIHNLEAKAPQAIIAATSRNPELAGGIYPFPLIEDGDFDIPSVYMKDIEWEKLKVHEGREVALSIKAERFPAIGCNVIARKGNDSTRRVVVMAHIDAKDNSPGAIDNAVGIVVLLLLSELLREYRGNTVIEIVAVNGEDYYSAPGEIDFVESNADKFSEILLGVNMDGPGYKRGKTAYSMYECPDEITGLIQGIFSTKGDMVEGEPWYQSDHSLFIQNGAPALAITSDQFMELSTRVTHTSKDHPDIVDCAKLVSIAYCLRDLLLDLDQSLTSS
ncbi:MAG: M28 family peptidase [Anaerolineales bacterium]|nr:M28 family peptidase [Anaerolineales bacterium]